MCNVGGILTIMCSYMCMSKGNCNKVIKRAFSTSLKTAVAIAAFGSLLAGVLTVWPSYTVPLYTSNTTTPLAEPLTQVEESLLGSLPSLGAMLGTVVAVPLLDIYGRRYSGVLFLLPFVISWAIISVTSVTNIILAARFFSGIGGGANLILAPIFISEVADDSIRGALAAIPSFLSCLGPVISYISGWFLPYHTIIWLNIVLSTVCVLLAVLAVESPLYLLKKNREEDARFAIAKYKGAPVSSKIVTEELLRLKQQLSTAAYLIALTDSDAKADEAEKQKLDGNNVMLHKKMSPIKLLFFSPASRRAFFVVFTVISTQVFMGLVPVQVYANTVFTQADPNRVELYTVLFALVMFLGGGINTLVADRAGRRLLLISSSVLVGVCMTALGFLTRSKDAPALVIVILILVYCFSFMLGAGSIPYVLMAEVFTSEVQNIASMIIVEWMWFLNFVIIGVFPYMLSALGIHGAFFTFAAISITNAVIGYFFVPETKSLSIAQIQDLFLGQRTK